MDRSKTDQDTGKVKQDTHFLGRDIYGCRIFFEIIAKGRITLPVIIIFFRHLSGPQCSTVWATDHLLPKLCRQNH